MNIHVGKLCYEIRDAFKVSEHVQNVFYVINTPIRILN